MIAGDTDAYIGLGSNLGDSHTILGTALRQMARWPRSRLVACSGIYRTSAQGYEAQDDFLNAVVRLACKLSPLGLLHQMQRTEQQAGRRRDGVRYGPRTLDLDLLLFGSRQINLPELMLPHPRLAQRRFVIEPLTEIAADLELAGTGKLADRNTLLANQFCERISDFGLENG